MHTSINVFIDVQNGKPRNDMDRKRYPRGKGWYTDEGYCEADILQFPPMVPVTSWAPTAQVIWHGAAEDKPPTSYTVSLNSRRAPRHSRHGASRRQRPIAAARVQFDGLVQRTPQAGDQGRLQDHDRQHQQRRASILV